MFENIQTTVYIYRKINSLQKCIIILILMGDNLKINAVNSSGSETKYTLKTGSDIQSS